MSQRRRNNRLNQRDTYPRFLIVCEGTKTEPNYFEHIRSGFKRGAVNINIYKFGGSGLPLIKAAMKQADNVSYTQVWCVFDRDNLSSKVFTTMYQQATKYGFNVAYSNPCFEVWYLLHFERCFARQWLDCDTCMDKLQQYSGQPYSKTSSRFPSLLDPQRDQAITRATDLLDGYSTPDPFNDNPSTTVHFLINEIKRVFL